MHFVRGLVATGIVLIAASAQAQPLLRSDPQRPVNAISHDLGVTPQQFIACFRNVRPAPKGTTPTAERQRANKAILLACLEEANPSITNDTLDAVMDKYRPEGRVVGR